MVTPSAVPDVPLSGGERLAGASVNCTPDGLKQKRNRNND